MTKTDRCREIRFLLLSVFFAFLFSSCHRSKDKILIAVIGPFSEKGAEDENLQAVSMRRGISMALDDMEKNGAIAADRYEFKFLSDGNDPLQAAGIAAETGNNKRFAAVIGHLYSAPSLAAAPLYKKYHIPAITLGATNNSITKDNPWYFRMTFTDQLQGKYLANYVCDILQKKHVAVIKEDDPYGNYLNSVFVQTVSELGGTVDFVRTINSSQRNTISETVHQLRKNHYQSPLFLAVHAETGIPLITLLKDENIPCTLIGPDSLASDQFRQGFDKEQKETKIPGFYTRDVVVSSPFILDTAGNEAQMFNSLYIKNYHQPASWTAVLAYDTAQLVLKGLHSVTNNDTTESMEICREKLRKYFSEIDSESKAVKGLAGYTFFDGNGDSQRPVAIGVYKGTNSIISALKQYNEIITNSENESFIQKEIADGHIISVNGKNMYRTNIVYAGARINAIENLKPDKLQCDLDFFLWFRCQGNFSIDDVTFLNAENPAVLDITRKEVTQENLIQYSLYHIKGTFKLNFSDTAGKFHEYTAGFALRHTNLTRNNLIFVPDLLGGSMEMRTVNTARSSQMLSPEYHMLVKSINAYQSIFRQPMYGHPDYLSQPEEMADFSRFNFEITVGKNELSDTLTIPDILRRRLLSIAVILMAVSFLIVKCNSTQRYLRAVWIIQFSSTMVCLFCIRTFFLNTLINVIGISAAEVFDTTYNVLFLMVPAYFFVRFFHYFIWNPIQKRTGQNIPDLFKKITAFVIYLLAVFGVLALVFHKRINSLLATSGFIAMVIGYAVRMNISNIFSGLVVNSERSFRIGDHVRIGSKYEGKIVNMNWRTVSLLNNENNIISIPNNVVADMDIVNLSRFKDALSVIIRVRIKSRFSPVRVKKILYDAVLSANPIMLPPEPTVTLDTITGDNLEFRICFYVQDYQDKASAKEAVWKRLWVHLYYAGICFIRADRGQKLQEPSVSLHPITLIDTLDIFKTLKKEEKETIVTTMRIEHYKKGQSVIRQGESGQSVYVMAEGTVGISVRTTENTVIPLERLGVGEIFGETALLTGERRNADVMTLTDSIIFHISKDTINSSLQDNRAFYNHLEMMRAEHKLNSKTKIAKAEKCQEITKPTFSERIKAHLKRLLHSRQTCTSS